MRRIFGRLLGPLLKIRLPLMKNLIQPLAKSVSVPLGLTTAASATDEMEDNMKIFKSLEDSGLLLKGVSETIQNEAREQKG